MGSVALLTFLHQNLNGKGQNLEGIPTLDMNDRLNYASKIVYFDQIRAYEVASQFPLYKKTFFLVIGILKILTKYLQFFLNLFRKSNQKTDCTEYDWILANDHSGHCELFMAGIIEKFSKNKNILYISINPKVKIETIDAVFQINTLNYFTVSSVIQALIYTRSRRDFFRGFGIWNVLIFLNYAFYAARIIEYAKFYKKIQFKDGAKLITLCDAHWHQSILTSEIKERGLKTFTLIHGMPAEWHLLSPFLSDYILTWGAEMSGMVLKHCQDLEENRIIEIGNTKYGHLKKQSFKKDYSFSDIDEIVFISPGFDVFSYYGLDGLKKEIIKFLELNLPGITLAIRPRPNPVEEKFIEKLINEMQMGDAVKILTNVDFSNIVNDRRIFVGSISSAISDVFILNGLFIGLRECIMQEDLEKMITYSEDSYFSMNELKKVLETLKIEKNFNNYLIHITNIKNRLTIRVPQNLDKYLAKHCL